MQPATLFLHSLSMIHHDARYTMHDAQRLWHLHGDSYPSRQQWVLLIVQESWCILVTKILCHESGLNIVPLLLIWDSSLITVLVNRLKLLQLQQHPEGSKSQSPPVLIRALAAGRKYYIDEWRWLRCMLQRRKSRRLRSYIDRSTNHGLMAGTWDSSFLDNCLSDPSKE